MRRGEHPRKALWGAYCVYPAARFITQQQDEEIVLLLRAHPITNGVDTFGNTDDFGTGNIGVFGIICGSAGKVCDCGQTDVVFGDFNVYDGEIFVLVLFGVYRYQREDCGH